MHPLQLRERVQRQEQQAQKPAPVPAKPSQPMMRPMRAETVVPRKMRAGVPIPVQVRPKLAPAGQDQRIQHELKEMQETQDLQQIDDDVEDLATMYEWRAHEHTHQPKNATWFMVLAASITIVCGILVFLGNLIGAITVGLVGGLTYYVAQRHPAMMRYRLMVDGVAVNNLLYHYKNLQAFNIIYEPGEVKTVIVRGKRTFAPLLHLEIGDADPVAIRDILLEFLPEDQEMEEPVVDILARRLGF